MRAWAGAPLPRYRRWRFRYRHSVVENSGQSPSLDGRLFRSMAATVTGERIPGQSTFAGVNRKLPAGFPRMGRTYRWYRRLCIRFS